MQDFTQVYSGSRLNGFVILTQICSGLDFCISISIVICSISHLSSIVWGRTTPQEWGKRGPSIHPSSPQFILQLFSSSFNLLQHVRLAVTSTLAIPSFTSSCSTKHINNKGKN